MSYRVEEIPVYVLMGVAGQSSFYYLCHVILTFCIVSKIVLHFFSKF